MHRRGVTTDVTGRERRAAGDRQRPRNECAPHLANRGTAQGCRMAVLAAVVHGRTVDTVRWFWVGAPVIGQSGSSGWVMRVTNGFSLLNAVKRQGRGRVSGPAGPVDVDGQSELPTILPDDGVNVDA